MKKLLENDNQIESNWNQIDDINVIEKVITESENRSFHHSFLIPTGYFLEKDKEYLIHINKSANFAA